MKVKMAINTVTIKPTEFMKKLMLISQVGFSGVGLWLDEIQGYLKGGEKKPVKELLKDHALTPVDIHVIRGWQYLGGSERKRGFSEAQKFFENVKKLGIDCPVAAVPSEEVGEIGNAINDFKQLCLLADDFNIKVVFEFTGFAKQINNVKVAWEIVGGADCPNGGLLIDTCHFVKGGSRIEDLKQVPMEKVFMVHINDVKPLPLGIKEQSRRFRFFPGEGEAPLREIIQCFMEGGYNGFYCCEVFNEDYWLQDPLSILKRGKESMENLFLSAAN